MDSQIMISMKQEELKTLIRDGVLDGLSEYAETMKPIKSEADTLLTREELLKMLNICPTSLWAKMKAGSIPYKRVGRKVLFSKNEILASISNLNNSWRKYD